MKKLIESYKSGLLILANSLYGDINYIYKSEEEPHQNRTAAKKHKSYGHLKVIK